MVLCQVTSVCVAFVLFFAGFILALYIDRVGHF